MSGAHPQASQRFSGRLARVYTAWEKFIAGKPVNASKHMPRVILDSWKRCRDHGVDPHMRKVSNILKGRALDEILEQNRLLIEVSNPFLEILYSYVKGSGFSVDLFDATGHIVSIIDDQDQALNHRRSGFVQGSCWSEASMGTNGCGTALAEGVPVQICACEHFCRLAHPYSCSAAPIHGPDGEILGVINMTGFYAKVHSHTLGAVVSAAQAIENELRSQRATEQLRDAYDLQQAIFDSSQDALLAIGEDQRVRLVSEKARKLLKLHHGVVGLTLGEVFREKENESFVTDLLSSSMLMDRECTVFRGPERYRFTVSSNLINSSKAFSKGRILSFREIHRTRNLVTSTMGAKAEFTFRDIVGQNQRFLETMELGRRAARSTSNVLLLGESGTGKDIFAQAIHNSSACREGPYIAINCGAIPRELITSELFGYADGAFTGSRRGGNPGKFELADGGTIFLDEIGEMPLDLQIVLLRVIEERKVTRIGSNVSTLCDVRIIAATNKNLREEVSRGNFREDLYFRLNIFSMEMIPLRAKKDDIPRLAEAIIARLNQSLHTRINSVDQRVLDALMRHHWPGNVRELQNVIERMVNLAPGNELTPDLLPREILAANRPRERNFDGMSLEEMERLRIMELMGRGMTKNEMARQLKIARSTLYLKIKKYGLDQAATG